MNVNDYNFPPKSKKFKYAIEWLTNHAEGITQYLSTLMIKPISLKKPIITRKKWVNKILSAGLEKPPISSVSILFAFNMKNSYNWYIKSLNS